MPADNSFSRVPFIFPARPVLVLAGLLGWLVPVEAASLYSESFDSEASAKVLINALADTGLAYVDYSNFVRDQPGGGGPVTFRIPEAPNRIPGSTATRGVLLNSTYVGNARTLNLLAAASPGGAAVSFSGNYRLSFDMWLSIDRSQPAGTTETALFGIGQTGTATFSYARRSTGSGTFGWASPEGGIGASGDIAMYVGPTPAFVTENFADGGIYSSAFPQGKPVANTPNNQWSQVELVAVDGRVTLFLNGVKFGEIAEGALTDGFAGIGYEDPFTGSIPGGLNRQFGLFDNFRVDSIEAAPALETGVSFAFPEVFETGGSAEAEFLITNLDPGASFTLSSAVIDGADAADFSLLSAFPVGIPAGEFASILTSFAPATPNGLKVARLKLATTDPNYPEISLPLQGLRTVNSVEVLVTNRIGSVTVEDGTNTGGLTFTNFGDQSVTVSAPVFSGVDAAQFSIAMPFPIEVPAGDSVEVEILFSPEGARGVKTATLEFATTDPGVPLLTRNISSRYSFGPPLLAHYRMDDAAGTTLADASEENVAAGLQIRDLPFGFGQSSLLPGGAGTSVKLTPADTSVVGNFAVSNVPHLPNLSYSLWIKPEAKENLTNRRLLQRSSLFTLNGTLYSLFLTPSGNLAFAVNSATSAENIVVETGEGFIADDTTYHVVVTHLDDNGFGNGNDVTATRTRLYVDGVLIDEASEEPVSGFTDYQLTTTAEGLYIGTSTSAGQGYSGLIDDLQIYSIELDPVQVSGLFSQPGKTAFDLAVADFKVQNIGYDPATGEVSLTWNSQPGAIYSVQESTSTAGFTDVAGRSGIIATGTVTTATFPAGDGPRRFFRIVRTSP